MEAFPEMIGKDSSQIVCFPNSWQRRKVVMVARCAAIEMHLPLSNAEQCSVFPRQLYFFTYFSQM